MKRTILVVAGEDTEVVVRRPGASSSGMRADVLVVDSALHGGHDDLPMDAKTADWFNTSMLTRLRPGGKVVGA